MSGKNTDNSKHVTKSRETCHETDNPVFNLDRYQYDWMRTGNIKHLKETTQFSPPFHKGPGWYYLPDKSVILLVPVTPDTLRNFKVKSNADQFVIYHWKINPVDDFKAIFNSPIREVM